MPGSGEVQDRLFEVASTPGVPIGRRCMLLESGGRRVVVFDTTVIFVFDASDREAEAACMVLLSRAGLASDVGIASAFGVHRNTVGRLVARFTAQGMAAVVPAKRGPKGPSKANGEVLDVVASHAATMTGRQLVEVVAERAGVRLSLSYVQHLAALCRGQQLEIPTDADANIGSDAEGDRDAGVDVAGDDAGAGVAVDEVAAEPAEVGVGADVVGAVGFDPPPVLPGRVSGRYMGVTMFRFSHQVVARARTELREV